MRVSLYSLMRFGVGGLVLTLAAAVGLARIAPAPSGWRIPCPVAYTSINSFYLEPCGRGSVWIDLDGGATVGGTRKGDAELIEYASFSPWRDESGRWQVVGRWSWGLHGDSTESSYGLARVTFPGGEVLDHVETDVFPVSDPCWYPGTRARVLFAAGDGRLYQCAFEPAGGPGAPPDGGEVRPRVLTWNCPLPGEGGVYLTDPCWPSDPRMRNIIFVGLRRTPPIAGGTRVSGPTQIWWLRLSDDGGSIEEAGQLLGKATDGPDVVERCPMLGCSPAGVPVLAYLRLMPGQPLALYVAEIDMDREHGCPRLVAGSGAKVAENCQASPPIFSRDRRWLGVVQLSDGLPRLRRIPLDEGPVARSVVALTQVDRADDAAFR